MSNYIPPSSTLPISECNGITIPAITTASFMTDKPKPSFNIPIPVPPTIASPDVLPPYAFSEPTPVTNPWFNPGKPYFNKILIFKKKNIPLLPPL